MQLFFLKLYNFYKIIIINYSIFFFKKYLNNNYLF